MTNIIKFPGPGAKMPQKPLPPPAAPEPDEPEPPDDGKQKAWGDLTPDQQKALSVITSGMAFVLVGIEPTTKGADFFTALHGDPADLRNAQEHLPAVIGRLYDRKGI